MRVNLCRKCIKILGIHFSYDKKVTQQINFDRVFLNLETINIWKGRYLNIYGKIVVLKTTSYTQDTICNFSTRGAICK